MVYLSDVLNLPVLDSRGQVVGTVADLIVNTREAFPVVAALVVTPVTGSRVPLPARSAPLIIPWRQVVSIEEPRLRLTVPRENIQSYTPRPNDIYLARDILDKQIVDTQGRRVVKVNDLKLAQVKGVARLLGADISFWAFMRRLLPFRFNERLVPWNYVQPIDQEEPKDVHLRVPQTSLADLHPADLADLLEEMRPEAGVALLQSLDIETAADTLKEVEEHYQAPLVENLETEIASDLLEAMPPDEAADIIGDLPQEKAEAILATMEPEPAQEVKELLQYPDDTAGGRMTPEVFTLSSTMTVQQAIEKLRTEGPPPEVTYYLFVTTATNELVGVVPLRALITAKPDTPICDIMRRDLIVAHANDDQETVAGLFRKYNLMGIPVVDDKNHLLGMVTVDDILDVMHEESAEDISQAVGTHTADVVRAANPIEAAISRMAWLTLSLLGGLAAALIIRRFSAVLTSTLNLVYFLPLAIALARVVGAQALTVADRKAQPDIWRELLISLLVGCLAGLAVGLVAHIWAGAPQFGLIVGVSLALTLVVASFLGTLLPLLIRRFGLAATLAAGPVADGLNSVISVSVYLLLATSMLRYAGG